MIPREIYLTANEQDLTLDSGILELASDTVHYVYANFDLGQNWQGFDSVRAVFFNQYTCKSSVLDSQGRGQVPFEVLVNKGSVYVNLVGSVAEGDVLVDRLTTEPIECIRTTKKARLCEAEEQPITPSQYEQFVSNVKADADRAEEASVSAKTSADEAEASADRAEQASANAGYMFFYIDERGHLIYERTSNTQVDFYLGENGHLYVEGIA